MPDDRRSVGVRVRPNSHDFVRQLRQDLAAKKVTFTVKVGADTSPATRDVRAWASGNLKKIGAQVNVGASTANASRDVAAWRARIAGQGATNIKVGADMSQANRDVTVWREAAGRALEIRVKAKVDGVEGARRAMSRDVTVGVKADTAQAKRQIKDLSDEPGLFSIEVDAKTKKAKAKITEFFDEVQGTQATLDLGADVDKAARKRDEFVADTKKTTVSQQLDLDTKRARLQLLELKLKTEAQKLEIKAEVKTKQVDGFIDRLKEIEKRTGNLTVIRSLDLGPLTLGKPTGLIGTVATITTLAGLLPGAVTAVGALSDAIMRLAGAASIAPGAIGVLAASIATISFGTQGVGDAFGAMFDMWKEGASEQAQSASQLTSAHNNYRNAVVDEGRAQRDVARARKDSLHELRDLNNELRGGVLNEAQAILDLQKARDTLAKGGFDSNTDYLQARLDEKKAEQNLIDVREGNIGLQEKATEANVKGVEGSDRVQDALESQTRATQAAAAAAQALSDAQAKGTDATSKFNDMLGQLSPNAREFVEAFAGLKGPIGDFRNSIQDTIFQGTAGSFLQMFDRVLPTIEPGVQEIAKGLNQNLLQVFTELETGGPYGGKTLIERILGGTAETQKAITQLINPLVTGIGTLTAAGAEHMPQLVDLMTKLATRFSDFITEADQSGALDKFMDEGIDALSNLADTGINLIKIMNDFSTAFRGAFGEDLLTMIARVTGNWHEFLSSAEGQAKINEYMDKAKEIWEDWKPVLEDLPETFKAVSESAQTVLTLLLAAINPVTEALEHAPILVEGFATVWLGAKMLGAISTIWKIGSAVGGVLSSLRGITNLLPNLDIVAQRTAGLPGAATPGGGTPAVVGAPGAASAGSRFGRILGGVGTAAAAVAAPIAIAQVATDQQAATQSEIANFKARRDAAPDDAARHEIDKEFYGRRGINLDDLGGNLPKKGTMLYDLLGQEAAAGKLPGLGFKDGKFVDPKTGEELPGFFKGGYTDWGIKSGRMAELHGGEYVQPHPTVGFYGKEAMEAVHQRKAVISYDKGGSVPYGYPGNPMSRGGPSIGGGLGRYNPNVPGYIPGASGMGPWNSPFYRPGQGGEQGDGPSWKGPTRGPRSFEAGGLNDGLVYDPQTGQYVQTGSIHGQGGSPGPGIIDSIVSNTTSGLSNVAGNVTSVGGNPADAAVSPFGVTGTAPGPAGGGTTGGFGMGAFGNSFLSNLGIPGLGNANQQDSGPGWGEGGPPVGLGGGESGPNGERPFDMRNGILNGGFGIGPGPAGSGPKDWLAFTGKTLGTFGANLFGTLTSGILGGLGLSGVGTYFQDAMGIADNQLSAGGDNSTVQGPGSAQTAADVNGLIGTYDNMPTNPAYPGVGGLPAPFDPSTGSAVGSLKGLQTNTARGEAAIRAAFPWATNIGGVRADAKKWHPSGLALDVMTDPDHNLNDPPSPQGLAKGNALYAWLKQNQAALGIDYLMWGPVTGDKDHYNHIHVNFAASGFAPGTGPVTGLTAPPSGGQAGGQKGWGAGSKPPAPAKPPGAPSSQKLIGNSFEGGGLFSGPYDPAIDPASAYAYGAPRFDRPGVGGPDAAVIADPTFKGRYQPFAGAPWNPRFDPSLKLDTSTTSTSGKPSMPFWGNYEPMLGVAGLQNRSGLEAFGGHIAPPIPNKVMDRGGLLMPGTTLVHNYTNKPELVVPSYAPGGFFPPPQGVVLPPKPLPRPADVQRKITQTPPPRPQPSAPGPPQPGWGQGRAIEPPPPIATPPQGATLPPVTEPTPPPSQGPSAAPIGQANRPATGVGPGEDGDHNHPALSKGITSGFAAAGNVAAAAASLGSMGLGGGGGGGAMGGFISGLFGQAGKIANNIANVASSFLVGNITGGTTANPYGVTQRGNVPTGGSRVVDASTNHNGDVYTNNLDEWKTMQDRRENQRAQSNLGRWNET